MPENQQQIPPEIAEVIRIAKVVLPQLNLLRAEKGWTDSMLEALLEMLKQNLGLGGPSEDELEFLKARDREVANREVEVEDKGGFTFVDRRRVS